MGALKKLAGLGVAILIGAITFLVLAEAGMISITWDIVIRWDVIWDTLEEFLVPIILSAGVILAWWELRHFKKSRQQEFILNMSCMWDSEPFVESKRLIREIASSNKDLREALLGYRKNSKIEYYVLMRVPNYFEDLGFLVKEGYLDVRVADSLFGRAIIMHYRYFRNYIQSERDPTNPESCEYFKNFEELYKIIVKIRQKPKIEKELF